MAKPKAPANETAGQRFIRLANGRHAAASKAIDGLGKLVGSQYESNKEQHGKLFSTLRAKIDNAEKSLAANKVSAQASEGVL